MNKAEVQAALTSAGLPQLTEHIDLLVRDSIRITTKQADETTLAVGTAKFGGIPDLPAGASWPTWKKVPQAFLAQLRLADLQPYDTQKLLPPQGMLWFFYAAQQDIYGEDPADKGAWQVLFSEDVEHLQRASVPHALPANARFKASTLSYANELTMAVQPELEIPDLQWNNDEQKKYDEVFAAFHAKDDTSVPLHRIEGCADVLQDDMREQSLLNSHGISDWDSAEAKKLAPEAKDWQLLLQIDEDETAGMTWASAGRLYYWINAADLRAKQFAQTWFVLQSD